MKLKLVVDDINSVDAAYRALYTERDGKWHLTEVEGIKTQDDINKIQVALTKERTDHKALKERISSTFGDRRFEDIQVDLDRITELEATIAAGGGDKKTKEELDALVEARTNAKLAPVQRQLTEAQKKLDESNKTIDTYKTKDKTRAIHDALREAGLKAKITPEAMEDALMWGERVFDVDEETGAVTVKDNVGHTPGIDATVWFTEMEPKKPHWFGQTSGGGAGGNRQGKGGGINNPFSHEHWNLTEQGKLYTANAAQAERMAASAGTTVGGPKPAARQ